MRLRVKLLYWTACIAVPIFAFLVWVMQGCNYHDIDCKLWKNIYVLPVYVFLHLFWLVWCVFLFFVISKRRQKRFELT